MGQTAALPRSIAEKINAELAQANAQVVACNGDFDFTRGELMAAFGRVQNPDGWKLEIDVAVEISSERERLAIIEAVIFFAGCRPTLTCQGRPPVTQPGHTTLVYRVTAVGYYEAVGA